MLDDKELSSRIINSTSFGNEKERVEVLKSYDILDTNKDEEFDRLTELASIICEVPFAAVSLLDENRQWFKSKVGFEINESDRKFSFCQFAIKGNSVFEVEDATKDDRFKNNPLVTGLMNFRFYAGYPLIDPDGFALGTLCVIDQKAKKLNKNQHLALSTLAKEVVSQIVARKVRVDKKHFEELFINSLDLVCLAGTDGFFKKVNPAFTTVLGWSSSELIENPFVYFVHPDDKRNTLAEMDKLSKGISSINFRNRYLTKSGEYKMLNWVANPDNLLGVVYAIAHDETDFHKSQQQLLMAERKFRDVFENSPDAIFVEDIDGNILDANTAATILHGLPKKKLVGSNIKDMVPKEKFPKIICDYKKLFSGETKTLESYLWSAQRGEIPVEVSGKKISYENKSVLLLQVRDISERKKIEKERAQSIIEKNQQREAQVKVALKIKDDERNRIAAEMHDEVGTGLSRISILGHVIRKSYDDPSVVMNNIEKILFSSKTVQENISEIIWAMNPKNDTLENLIAYINNFTAEFLETSSIVVKIILPENIPVIIINGKIRRNIFLVVKESLNNLVKYSKATEVSLVIGIENDSFSLILSDNGIGFEIDTIPRFSNGIQNMKKRIVDIEGKFDIVSNKQIGTTIFLKVPIHSAANELGLA